MLERFSLDSQIIVITGGAGFLGLKHAEAVIDAGGIPALLDINEASLGCSQKLISENYNIEIPTFVCDITNKADISNCLYSIIKQFGRVDGLVNNAANDPKVGVGADRKQMSRFENISLDVWNKDFAVGLTGAFLCSQVFGHHMACNNGGVIVNVSSDLSVISPDQRLYEIPNISNNQQPVKPVTYSVVKSGLIGLTKYLATYWAENHVRVNAISPGGVFNGQSDDFVKRLSQRIPMNRMASPDEYQASLLYLLSDASSYLTGFNLVVDGGRSVW